MAQLTEDLILEILSFLPWKSLVARKFLNKSLMQAISGSAFQYQYALRSGCIGSECLLHKASPPNLNSFLRIELPSRRHGSNSYSSSTIFKCPLPIVLASSGGLLLLWLTRDNRSFNYYPYRTLCIFNPVTGAYLFIPYLADKFIIIGLVVLNNLGSYKLVGAVEHCNAYGRYCYRFSIYEPGSRDWRQCRRILVLNKELLMTREHEAAFNLNGSMYWLTGAGEILAFNIETEVAELINQQPEEHRVRSLNPETTCFGAIGDKLAVVTVEEDSKIFLRLYDPTNRKWKIDRIFQNYAIPLENWDPISTPVFYDGDRLILVSTWEGEACIQEITANSVEKIMTTPMLPKHWRIFRHFVGTLTEIPDCLYLVNGLKAIKRRIPDDLSHTDYYMSYFRDLLFIRKCCLSPESYFGDLPVIPY